MRCIAVTVLGALLCWSAPAKAACLDDRDFASGCARWHPYDGAMAFSLMPGRGIVNSLLGMEEEPPPPRLELPPVYVRPPMRASRRHFARLHRGGDVDREVRPRRGKARRAAKAHRDMEFRRLAKLHRAAEFRHEAKARHDADIRSAPKPRPSKDIRPLPKPRRVSVELDQAAPPQPDAAAELRAAGEKPLTPARAEAIEMLRQREDWLDGLSQKGGFERW